MFHRRGWPSGRPMRAGVESSSLASRGGGAMESIWKKHWPEAIDEKSIRLPEELLPVTLARQARRVPDRTAIQFYGRVVTFAELDSAVGRFACRLPKSFSKTGRWASGVRAMDRNVPRTRSLGRPARGAQDPHRPRAREPGAPTAARPAQPPIEATPIRAVVALQPVVWMAPGALPRTPRDRNSLAPAGLPRLLDLEVPPRATRSTAGWLGDCGSRARHGARESPLGRATHPRRIAQARTRRLAAKRRPAHAASPETAIADLAHVPPKPPRRPRLHRLLRRADRYLSRALRVRGPAASSPPGRALQRDRFPHRRLDRAASRRGVPR